MDIVQLVMKQMGSGGMIEKVASACGISTDQARTAESAAIPAVLAGLMQTASTPDGARKLNAAVDAADDPSRGGDPLQSLLGVGTMSGLSGAIEKFTGLGGGAIKSLLAMLAPMILGIFKKEKQSLGLDAQGLAGMLSSQKQNILSAMPAGLSGLMGSIPGLGALTDAGRSAASAAGDAYDRGRTAVASGAQTVRRGISPWLWIIPLALLVGYLGWTMMRGQEPAKVSTPAVVPKAREAIGSNVDDLRKSAEALTPANVSAQFGDVMTQLTDTATQVKDSASAETASTKLRELSSKLDSIIAMKSSLPADIQSKLASAAETGRITVKAGLDKASAIPGAADKIKPIADEVMKKIDALAVK